MIAEVIVKSVLIVEDDTALREALRDKLVRENFAVFEANNGEEGLRMAVEKHPDIIILDILMPVVDGMTMLKNLRQDPWGRSAHVILLTNLDGTDKVAEALEHETFEYYVKSDIKLEDFVAKVKESVGRSAQ